MKHFVLALILCAVTSSVFSQFENIWKRKPWLELKFDVSPKVMPVPADSTTIEVPEVLQNNGVIMLPITKTKQKAIDASTDLYIIKPYQMPCIAPSNQILNNMPVANYNLLSHW